jgi:hypothetical protein
MKVARLSLLLFGLISAAYLVIARAPSFSLAQPQAATRDAQSLQILARALAAMGGNSINQLQLGVLAQGTLSAAPGGISGNIRWETQGGEFRYEHPGPNGAIVYVSGHGNPAIVDGEKVQRNIGHMAMTNLPPHLGAGVLALNVNNPAEEIDPPQQVTVGGGAALKISFRDTTDELSSVICRQDWYLDAATLLPLRVDFLTAEALNALNTAKMSYLFSNYQTSSGVRIPLQVVVLFKDQEIFQLTFDAVQIGVSLAPSDFDVPE